MFVLKELHDRLLAAKPEGASHDESTCPVCTPSVTPEAAHEDQQGGSMKTYTEDEYNSLLVQVADLESKVKELEGVRAESEVEARVAEAKAQFDSQVEDLQAQLDTAVLEAKTAQDEKANLIAYFEELKAHEERAAEIASLREQRIARVKEVASFPEDHIAARADAWAALDEEHFEALVADWAAIAKKESNGEIPVETAMVASRSDNPSKDDALRDVLRFRFQGIDTRTV
jgi:DNA repair exonuclease SbcCD ATPase subunit